MAEMNEAYLHEIQLYVDKRHKSSVHTTVSNSRWNHRYGWHNGAKGQWMCDLLTKGIQTDKNVSAGEQQCQMFNRTELFYHCLSIQVWIIQHFQVFFFPRKVIYLSKRLPFLKYTHFLLNTPFSCPPLDTSAFVSMLLSLLIILFLCAVDNESFHFSLMYSSCHLLVSLNGQWESRSLVSDSSPLMIFCCL